MKRGHAPRRLELLVDYNYDEGEWIAKGPMSDFILSIHDIFVVIDEDFVSKYAN